MFMGRKAKPRTYNNGNTQNNNSLSQMIKNISSNNNQRQSKTLIPTTNVMQSSMNRPVTNSNGYNKYLNEY